MMEKIESKTVGQIVAEDYRTSDVFRKYNIDFCCGGNRTVNDACEKKGIDYSELMDELEKSVTNKENKDEFSSMELDALCDHIEKKHHAYVEQRLPLIHEYLEKIARVHGSRHPGLLEVYSLFSEGSGELAAHMKKEELMLFPHIRKMAKSIREGEALDKPSFGSVANPVEAMMQEHDNEGDRFRRISEITNGYEPPEDACNTYRVAFHLLQEFENDLHLHIHLENNILFPKALELENSI